MMAHHVITILLIFFSYLFQFVRIGTVMNAWDKDRNSVCV
jgi:hypothetical protein